MSFSQIVPNGGFRNSSQWTLGSGWSITGGKLVGSSVPAFTTSNVGVHLQQGKTYQFTMTVSEASSGTVRAGFLGGTTLIVTSNIGAPRTETFEVTPNAGNDRVFVGSAGAGFTGAIDIVIVSKMTPFNDIIKPADVPTPIFNDIIRTYAGEEPWQAK